MGLRFLQFTISLLMAASSSAQEPETIDSVPVNPLSVSGLRELANATAVEFKPELERQAIKGIRRQVVSFYSDELRQFALVLEPAGTAPDEGWPVLLMNHGHHPNPPQYGRVASGETERPGDYYRGLPMTFAEQGFMVVVPDFRGHNESAGLKFAKGPLESNLYTRDSIVAFRAIDSLPRASGKHRFIWGHSMGGAVTLRAMLALKNRVKGASIWASTTTDSWNAGIYYSLNRAGLNDSLSDEKPALSTLMSDIKALPFEFKPQQGDATRFTGEFETPLNIHHSIHDLKSTPYHWSVELAGKLYTSNKAYHFYSYPGDKHLFEGENLQRAVNRDVLFFRSLLSTEAKGSFEN